jgi:hypothetical protein
MRELALPHTSANWCDVIRLRQICDQATPEIACNVFPQFQRNGTKSSPFDGRDNWATRSTLAWSRLNEAQFPRMAKMAKHPHTKINLIRSLASRQDGVTQAELRKATGWKLVPMPLIAKRCKMKLITKREKGNVTRKNGKIASKSGHFTTYYMMAHDSTTAVADATTDTVRRKPYPSIHKPSDAENAS